MNTFRSIISFLGNKYVLALAIVSLLSVYAVSFRPVTAKESNHPTAEAAAKWLRDNAETHDAWKKIESEWNRQKKIVTQDMGCTLTAERTIIECHPIDFQ